MKPSCSNGETPISDILRKVIVKVFGIFRLLKDTETIKEFEIGTMPGEIIIRSKSTSIPCLITEDEKFIYFRMPSGFHNMRISKKKFFELLQQIV